MTIELITNYDSAPLRKIVEGRGWTVVNNEPDAYYVARGWRDARETYHRVRELMADKAKIYWEPQPPPNLNCPDYYGLAGCEWQDVTKPYDEAKRRKKYQVGMPISEGYHLADIARQCGHKVTVALSQFNPKTVVVTVHADRRRTFYVKLWASNETQARNALEELASAEVETI